MPLLGCPIHPGGLDGADLEADPVPSQVVLRHQSALEIMELHNEVLIFKLV